MTRLPTWPRSEIAAVVMSMSVSRVTLSSLRSATKHEAAGLGGSFRGLRGEAKIGWRTEEGPLGSSTASLFHNGARKVFIIRHGTWKSSKTAYP